MLAHGVRRRDAPTGGFFASCGGLNSRRGKGKSGGGPARVYYLADGQTVNSGCSRSMTRTRWKTDLLDQEKQLQNSQAITTMLKKRGTK